MRASPDILKQVLIRVIPKNDNVQETADSDSEKKQKEINPERHGRILILLRLNAVDVRRSRTAGKRTAIHSACYFGLRFPHGIINNIAVCL